MFFSYFVKKADVAQLVEHFIGNEEVTGPIPVVGSNLTGFAFSIASPSPVSAVPPVATFGGWKLAVTVGADASNVFSLVVGRVAVDVVEVEG